MDTAYLSPVHVINSFVYVTTYLFFEVLLVIEMSFDGMGALEREV